MSSKKIEVVIDGASYTLLADDGAENTKEIAEHVDRKIKESKEGNKQLATSHAYILALMNVAGELFKLKEDHDDLKEGAAEPIKRERALEQRVKGLEEEKQDLEDSLTNIKDELVSSLKTISEINEDMEGLRSEADQRSKDLADREAQISKLVDNLDKVQKELTNLQKAYQDLIKKKDQGDQ